MYVLFTQVELCKSLFFTSKAEIDASVGSTAPGTKRRLVSRNACMLCGRVFASRGKLFKHVQSDSRHDTTPELAAEVVQLCLTGRAKWASEALWGYGHKAH